MKRYWVLFLPLIVGLATGWMARRPPDAPPTDDPLLQHLGQQQVLLQNIDQRIKTLEHQIRRQASAAEALATSSSGSPESAARKPSANNLVLANNVVSFATAESIAARETGDHLLAAALFAGRWTDEEQDQFRQALQRMSADDRYEMMKRLVVATNNQRLNGPALIAGLQ